MNRPKRRFNVKCNIAVSNQQKGAALAGPFFMLNREPEEPAGAERRRWSATARSSPP
jgi:hypothetical protein